MGLEDALADAGAEPEWMEVERFFAKKDRHYAKVFLQEMEQYERFHEQTRQGIHACGIQRTACMHLDEHLTKLNSEVDQNVREQVRQQRQERHAMETRHEKLAEQSIAEARGLMAEEQASRGQAHVYTEEVTNEVCHLYNDLEQAKNYRIQKSEKLQEVVTEKLEEIEVAITAEKKIREESTHTLLELFGQMGTKMQQEIDSVRIERKEATDRLIALMEVVLPHLEQARLNHIKVVKEKLEEKQAGRNFTQDLVSGAYAKRQTLVKRSGTVVDALHPSRSKVQQEVSKEALGAMLPMMEASAVSQAMMEASAVLPMMEKS